MPELPSSASLKNYWSNISNSLMAFELSRSLDAHSGQVLMICKDGQQAMELSRCLRTFSTRKVIEFPDWETLPYDTFSPHQDIVSERLACLYQLPQAENAIVIISATTLLQRLPPVEWIQANVFMLKNGQQFDVTNTRTLLQQTGYLAVDTVFHPGEYAVRGSIIDIFPMGSDLPIRIDLFDDEIDSLRHFSVEDQRSMEGKLEEISILPAREVPLDDESIERFLDNWHQAFQVDHRQVPLYQDVSEGIAAGGIEYYLSLFFDNTATFFDYLSNNCLACYDAETADITERFLQDVEKRYESKRVDPQRPLLAPAQIYCRQEELFSLLKPCPAIIFSKDSLNKQQLDFAEYSLSNLVIEHQLENPYKKLENHLQQTEDKIIFCAESQGRRETLLEHFDNIKLKVEVHNSWAEAQNSSSAYNLVVAPVYGGFKHQESGLEVITESELFGQQVLQRRRRQQEKTDAENVIKNLTELKVGAPVVHIEHGVGRYLGLENLTIEEQQHEFLMLQYAEEAKLYVPVSDLHLISRYSASNEELAPLHRLGSEQWAKQKKKAAEKIHDVAAELLDVYAKRASRTGIANRLSKVDYQQFSAEFPFEETLDQETTIQAVVNDLTNEQPMDRLVCGDVGFGKTEVAMRAAFIAAQNSRQVAILVPTTLLAQQHFENFRDRFANWPINIQVLSRFKTAREQEQVIEDLKAGKVDIVVGTHKLLSRDIKFKDLGLLIIDEEHRFGVKQKEKIKAMRAEVDILTLTATPIPRTLNMSMAGMRDLSIIATPPAKRLSVKTFVKQRDEDVIREAVLREILRGGQVYFLHNEVDTIEKAARELQELIPEARVATGHGQMRERELEQLMTDFYHQRFNVLVCTTIIETGIDIPNANTIIINRADKFGLAQLHQLRGRVGRSHHQAYAYLLTPAHKRITKDAEKRLLAISEAQELGAGFMLATHDLEIRGAGELLGEDQSGQINTIGYSLYMEMLEQAVQAIRQGKTPDYEEAIRQHGEINLRIPALIPDDYLPDVHNRLTLYKRIASASSEDELQQLQVEIIDRFGLLPEPLKNLFRVTKLRQFADKLGVKRIEATAAALTLEFSAEPNIDPLKLVELVQQFPNKYRMEGASTLKFRDELSDYDKRIMACEQVLRSISR